MDEKHLERIGYTYQRCLKACQSWLEACQKSGAGVSVNYVECVKQTKACTDICAQTIDALSIHISHFSNEPAQDTYKRALENSIRACKNFIETCQSCVYQCQENGQGVQGVNCVMACKDCSQACQACIDACLAAVTIFK